MSEIFLRGQSLGLDLPVYTQDQRKTRETLGLFLKAAFSPPKRELRTTLDGINFDFKPGDRVGLLGRNGAGKSTLLKILVGAYPPSRGILEVGGKRHALLNLSLGFDAEATLVENIILRGIAMGLKAKQAGALVDEVLNFAELDVKASDRLRTLSAGQRMRLGFSLATSIRNDILIMDEWIGTGDAAFVSKAQERMQSRVQSAQIVVIASHNLKLLRRVCNTGIVLENGRMAMSGDMEAAIECYKNILQIEA